ncbi:MAG: release factor glutamine methyltransferase [Pseudonocardiales bacterium]|nr:release factor glutamine methyltransferase [Pseudonocardiales bacterium]
MSPDGSVGALLADATRRLADGGIDTPRVDAELLLAHALGVARSRLVLLDAVPGLEAARFTAALDRRAAREPLQYITGTAPFRRVQVAVGPGVFVPRPETELLVDAVLPALTGADEPVLVDLCAGSGALALAIADEVPATAVYAVEGCGDALVWLQRNAADRVHVVAADVRRPLLLELCGRVSAVVSNPPYVPDATVVSAEVRQDPSAAVFAGADGLRLIPAVIARAAELLRPGGVLALEHDESQADAVPALLHASGGWAGVEDHHDLAGRPRYARAVRR